MIYDAKTSSQVLQVVTKHILVHIHGVSNTIHLDVLKIIFRSTKEYM